MEEYGFVKELLIQEVQNLRGSGTGTLLYTIAFLYILCRVPCYNYVCAYILFSCLMLQANVFLISYTGTVYFLQKGKLNLLAFYIDAFTAKNNYDKKVYGCAKENSLEIKSLSRFKFKETVLQTQIKSGPVSRSRLRPKLPKNPFLYIKKTLTLS
jgi:hypothetical protein